MGPAGTRTAGGMRRALSASVASQARDQASMWRSASTGGWRRGTSSMKRRYCCHTVSSCQAPAAPDGAAALRLGAMGPNSMRLASSSPSVPAWRSAATLPHEWASRCSGRAARRPRIAATTSASCRSADSARPSGGAESAAPAIAGQRSDSP